MQHKQANQEGRRRGREEGTRGISLRDNGNEAEASGGGREGRGGWRGGGVRRISVRESADRAQPGRERQDQGGDDDDQEHEDQDDRQEGRGGGGKKSPTQREPVTCLQQPLPSWEPER